MEAGEPGGLRQTQDQQRPAVEAEVAGDHQPRVGEGGCSSAILESVDSIPDEFQALGVVVGIPEVRAQPLEGSGITGVAGQHVVRQPLE